MATKTVKAANDVARKGLAVVLAALLCMPMTGLEYPAYADEAASDAVAGQDQSAQPQENEALTPPLPRKKSLLLTTLTEATSPRATFPQAMLPRRKRSSKARCQPKRARRYRALQTPSLR